MGPCKVNDGNLRAITKVSTILERKITNQYDVVRQGRERVQFWKVDHLQKHEVWCKNKYTQYFYRNIMTDNNRAKAIDGSSNATTLSGKRFVRFVKKFLNK